MSSTGRPPSWTGKLLRGSAYLFAAIILVHLTIALIREIWWVFVIAALMAAGVVVLRWWYRRRNEWE